MASVALVNRADVHRSDFVAVGGHGIDDPVDLLLGEAAERPLLRFAGLPGEAARLLDRAEVRGLDGDGHLRRAPADQAFFNEFHALLVEVGKRYCKKQAPRCDQCPLGEFLPQGPLRDRELASRAASGQEPLPTTP